MRYHSAWFGIHLWRDMELRSMRFMSGTNQWLMVTALNSSLQQRSENFDFRQIIKETTDFLNLQEGITNATLERIIELQEGDQVYLQVKMNNKVTPISINQLIPRFVPEMISLSVTGAHPSALLSCLLCHLVGVAVLCQLQQWQALQWVWWWL